MGTVQYLHRRGSPADPDVAAHQPRSVQPARRRSPSCRRFRRRPIFSRWRRVRIFRAFYTHEFFQPGVVTYNLPCPDFVLSHDISWTAAESIAISGTRQNRKLGRFSVLQLFSVESVSPIPRGLATGIWTILRLPPDGRFEITVSAERVAGNWIRLDLASRFNWAEHASARPMRANGRRRSRSRRWARGRRRRCISTRLSWRGVSRLVGRSSNTSSTRMTYARVQETVLKETGGPNRFHVVS